MRMYFECVETFALVEMEEEEEEEAVVEVNF